jgi:O-antigen ligase
MERFLRVGGWTIAGICAVTGVVAGMNLLGGPKLDWFFEYSRRGATDKFTGLMRYSNQWSGYFVTVFPLLLALAFSKLKGWHRPLVVVCALLGILTVPASGSRSGLFLLVGEVVGFVGLYLMLNRSDKALNRLIYIVLFGALLLGGYFMLGDQLGDSPIVQRSFGAFELVFEQEQFSDSWRDYNWRSAMTEYAKHPLIGIGLGTFEIYYDRHEVHSTYLSFLTETGVLGLIPYLVLLGLSVLQLVRSFIAHVAQGRTNLLLIALLMAIGSQLLFAIHHNNARHRHVWTLLLIGLLYAEVSLTHLRRELRQARQARSAALRVHSRRSSPQS